MIKSSYEACSIIEDFDGQGCTEEEYVEAFQFLIDNGQAWQLQGFYGRAAQHLIEEGLCAAKVVSAVEHVKSHFQFIVVN